MIISKEYFIMFISLLFTRAGTRLWCERTEVFIKTSTLWCKLACFYSEPFLYINSGLLFLCVFNVSFRLNLWCESVVRANFHVFMLKINWRWCFVPGLSVLCVTSLVFSLRDACGPFCYPSVPPPFKEPCIVVHIRPYQVLWRVGVYRLLLRCIDCSSIALSDHAPGARGPARSTVAFRSQAGTGGCRLKSAGVPLGRLMGQERKQRRTRRSGRTTIAPGC